MIYESMENIKYLHTNYSYLIDMISKCNKTSEFVPFIFAIY